MTDYDVIVVGGRVSGATTAMLLARQGVRVLLVDRAGFPSDTISSHQVQVPGVARLQKWGLLARLRAAGTPPTSRIRFDPGHVVLEGQFPEVDGVNELISPRRTILDSAILDAARTAGAEVRERFRVDELVWREGRVTGIRGVHRGGAVVTETAPLIVGADGKHSLVAEQADARRYRQRPVMAFACYSYWSGLPVTGGELYQRRGAAVAVFPTNHDLVMVYVAAPISDFARVRSNPESHYLAALERCGDLAERASNAERVERMRCTADQPNGFRVPHGPGWALVGDAGLVMDSISAQGISNALLDAELLVNAIVAGLGGQRPLAATLAERHRRRDRAVRPMYDFTVALAGFSPPSASERLLLASLVDRQHEIDRFLGAFAGIVPLDEYFSAANLSRVLGPRRLSALAVGTARERINEMRERVKAVREPRAGKQEGAGGVGTDFGRE